MKSFLIAEEHLFEQGKEKKKKITQSVIF